MPSAAVADDLRASLLAAADDDGLLCFADYMELALYGAGGYYQQRVRLGTKGADFYTAAQFPLFGQTLGKYISERYTRRESSGVLCIVEFGPGQGELAAEICSYLLADRGLQVPIEYMFVERSTYLQKVQRQTVESLRGRVKFSWLNPDTPPTDRFEHAFVVANELLDALPVERIRRTENGYERGYVKLDETDPAANHPAIREVFLPADEELTKLAETFAPIPVGHQSELCPNYKEVFRYCGALAEELDGLFFDYGTFSDEWREGIRPAGTLRGFRNHEVVNPLEFPGECDITADVNWDLARDAAQSAGLMVLYICSQGSFLVRNGITDVATALSSEATLTAVSSAIKQLVLPGGMGERFSAFVFEKQRGGVVAKC